MNYLKRKKIAFMPYVSGIKGFRTIVSGKSSVVMPDCVDSDSIIDYTIRGSGDACSGVGDKTVNLFDSTQLLEASDWSVDENGVYSGKVSVLWAKFNYNGQFDIEIPGDAQRISITWEGKNESVNATTFTFIFFYEDGTSSQLVSQYVKTTQWEKYMVQSNKGKRVTAIKAGYSRTDDISLRNIQITATTEYLEYEPFGKFKIPVLVSGEDGPLSEKKIYIDRPLQSGESINMKKDSLPKLSTIKGTTTLTIGTSILPEEVSVTYFSSRRLRK